METEPPEGLQQLQQQFMYIFETMSLRNFPSVGKKLTFNILTFIHTLEMP